MHCAHHTRKILLPHLALSFHIQTGYKSDQAFLGSMFVAQLPTHPATSQSQKAHTNTYLHSQTGCCGQGSSTQVCTGRRFDPEPAPCIRTAAPQSQCRSRPAGSRESPWHQQGCSCTLDTQNVPDVGNISMTQLLQVPVCFKPVLNAV